MNPVEQTPVSDDIVIVFPDGTRHTTKRMLGYIGPDELHLKPDQVSVIHDSMDITLDRSLFREEPAGLDVHRGHPLGSTTRTMAHIVRQLRSFTASELFDSLAPEAELNRTTLDRRPATQSDLNRKNNKRDANRRKRKLLKKQKKRASRATAD